MGKANRYVTRIAVKDEKLTKDYHYCDRLGNEIKKFDIVAYSTSIGKGAIKLAVIEEVYIGKYNVNSINTSKLHLGVADLRRLDSGKRKQKYKFGSNDIDQNNKIIFFDCILTKMPEFYIDREEIQDCFEVIDQLRDEESDEKLSHDSKRYSTE